METLLNALKELYNEHDNSYYAEGEEFFQNTNNADKVSSLCNALLIEANGFCNWTNIAILRKNGYNVFAGEKDSFGWLTGCIQKNGDNRILVYG